MALHWRPVGPEPEKTYWQRRAVAALVVLLPLWLVVSALGGGGDDAPDTLAASPAPSPARPAASPAMVGPTAASPVPSPTPAVTACAADALDVDAKATTDEAAAGSAVRLELRVVNTTAVPCTRDLGQAAVELLVYSGDDRIWSSDDCSPGGGARVTTLAPGKAEVSRVTWPGTRSLPGCEGSKAKAQPGTYRVTARVGEQRQQGEAFRLR